MRRNNAVLPILLAALLAMPLTIFATGTADNISADTTGSEVTNFDGYIQITNIQELSDIRKNLSGKYYLANDIVFDSGTGSNFTPIGTYGLPFGGILDGNGYVIDGMRTDVRTSYGDAYSGLFGCVSYGKVMNLGIVNGSSTATASSSSDTAYAGGIAGLVSSGEITNCYNTGSVSASSSGYAYAGGIAGYLSGEITNCCNTGSVSASVSSSYVYRGHAGGIAGYARSTAHIVNSYYLTGKLSVNGVAKSNALYGNGSPSVDGGSRSTSSPDQRSGAKTLADMTPDLSTASANKSIYFTGYAGEKAGWDFGTVWTFDDSASEERINGGLPVLRAFLYDVSVTDPHPVTVLEGESARFEVSVSSSPDAPVLACRWQVSSDGGLTWNDVPGVRGSIFGISSADMSFDGNLYRITVYVPGYNDSYVVSDAAALTVLPSFRVTGTIDHGGNGLEDADVAYTLDGVQYSAHTDHDGKYSITAQVGKTVKITEISAYGYDSLYPNKSFTANETADFTMSMKMFTVSGTVSSGGMPVANAEIVYNSGDLSDISANTDRNGAYSITAQVGKTINITGIRSIGYHNLNPNRSFTADETADFTMSEAYFTVYGYIYHEGSGTVAGAEIKYTVNGNSHTVHAGSGGYYSIMAQKGNVIKITEVDGAPVSGTSSNSFSFDTRADYTVKYGLLGSVLVLLTDPGKAVLVFAIAIAAAGSLAGAAIAVRKKKKSRI